MSMEKTKKTIVIEGIEKALMITVAVILALYCLSLLLPIYWMLVTSLKDGQLAYLENPFGLPTGIRLQNFVDTFGRLYVQAVRDGSMAYYWADVLVFNSVVYSVGTSFWSLFLTTMCAYVISKYKFRGRRFLYNMGVFVMLFPIGAELAAEMYLRQRTFTYNNLYTYILTSPTAAFSGVNFMVMYAAFRSLSWNYAEAVFLDGGGHYTVFFRIMFPMISPMFMAWYMLTFLGKWNDYMSFVIWLPGYPNLALGMFYFQELAHIYRASTPMIMAGFTVILVPTVVLFLLSRRLMLTKINVGGLKE